MSRTAQLAGSLIVAVVIVVGTIVVVTDRFGATSAAERELQEERLDQREDLLKERQELLEERRED